MRANSGESIVRTGAGALEPVPIMACFCRWRNLDAVRRRRRGGKHHGETRAATDLALHRYATAVTLDEALDDRQAQTRPAELARRGAVHLIEALKDVFVVLARDAHPGVLDRDSVAFGVQLGLKGDFGQGDGDLASLRGELHRIGQKIDHRLAQLLPVSGASGLAFRNSELKDDASLLRLRRNRGERRSNDFGHVHRLESEADLARLDLADVEDRGDQLQQGLALVQNRLHILRLLIVDRTGQSLREHFGVPMIEVNGVRSSWLTVARKLDLRRS